MLILSAVQEELGDLAGHPVGIGPVMAAMGAAALIERLKPRAVLVIGTAGSYAGGPEIGAVVRARRVGLSSSAAVMGLGYVPRPPAVLEADRSLLGGLDLPACDVLSVQAVTTDPLLAERLADGWQVEQLEAYGVAAACAAARVPFAAVYGISNRAGPDAHLEWLEHRAAARQRVREVVAGWLGRG